MSAEDLMQDTCTIEYKSQSQDATTGGVTTTWPTNAANVKCAIQQDSSSQSRFGQRETGEARWVGFFPYNTTIGVGDRIVWRSKTLYCDGPPIEDGRQTYYRVPLQERGGGGLP